ncbi:MAG: replication initiation protein [Saprospiraceae bacterium]
MVTHPSKKKVAAIANKFIQHARYKLTPREQKIILYMATLIKPEDSGFKTYLVPVSEIEYILKSNEDKKHGSFYERLDDLLDGITDKKISFPTDFVLDGVRLRGHINWVSGAIPKLNEDGILCVEFGFSPQMKPFLLGLKQKFTQIEFREVAQMKSGFSIRIFQMCKAYYYENHQYGRNKLVVGLNEFKERLGIPDKYPDFRNFRRKVLDVARGEINEKTSLLIEYEYLRKKRKITTVQIIINERKDFDDMKTLMTPTQEDKKMRNLKEQEANLSEAKLRAYGILLEYGINKKIALGEFLPIVKGSELNGYEDYFVQAMITFFEKKTDRTKQEEKIKALVGWLRNKRFTEANLFARLTEQVIFRKKGMTQAERDNRERAKTITATAFRQLIAAEAYQPVGTNHLAKATKAATPLTTAQQTPTRPSELFELAEEVKVRSPFSYTSFKKEHAVIYRQIRADRRAAFVDFKTASNYRQLLENSVKAFCEKWYNEQM